MIKIYIVWYQCRNDFIKISDGWIKKYALNEKNIIIGGDWNCCMNYGDRNTLTHSNHSSRMCIKRLVDNLDLRDIWHDLQTATRYTWSNKAGTVLSRFDYIFVSRRNCLKAASISLISALGTDHLALILASNPTSNKRGKGT